MILMLFLDFDLLSNTEISVCKFVDLLIVVELLIVVNMCDTASST